MRNLRTIAATVARGSFAPDRVGGMATAGVSRNVLERSIIGAMRGVVGLLWLANLEWKRPPNFGEDRKNGLYKYVDSAITHPVFEPYSWFVEKVIVPNFQLFGWLTLFIEAFLVVCLLLGWRTRLAALIGAGMTVNIFLSVLYYPKSYEWPWSYYLMFAIHLLLFATASGHAFGLDGVVRRGQEARDVAARWIGTAAIVVGVVGLIVARNVDFAANRGATLGWEKGELKLLWVTPLNSLLMIALGALAVAGVVMKQSILTKLAGVGFAAMALQVLIQWRNVDGGILGGTGANMALWATFAVGLIVCTQLWTGLQRSRTAVLVSSDSRRSAGDVDSGNDLDNDLDSDNDLDNDLDSGDVGDSDGKE